MEGGNGSRCFNWLIAIFAFIFLRGLRSGSSFIYNRYMEVEKFKGLEGIWQNWREKNNTVKEEGTELL